MDASTLKSASEALESAISALENRSDSLEVWFEFWTFLVVVGVVMEVCVVIAEYRHELREFRRATIHPPDRPNGWMFFFGALGAGLVAIGVGGELWVDIKAGTVETELRTKNRELIGLLQSASSDAIERAAKAQLEAANANRSAESERHERVKLEALVAPRRLSPEQQQQIGDAVRKFAGRKVDLRSYSLDAEGGVLAQQIKEALEFAQIDVQDNIANFFTVGGFIGGVAVTGPTAQQDLVTALQSSLKSDGKLAVLDDGKPVAVPDKNVVTILVGVKPPRVKK